MPEHVLVAEGLVTPVDVEHAERLRGERGGTIGAQLIKLGLIDEQAVALAFSRRLGVRLLRRDQLEGIPDAVLALVPAELAQTYRAVPLRCDQHRVLVVMADPSDPRAIGELRAAVGKSVHTTVATESAIDWAVQEYYGTSGSADGVILLTRRKAKAPAEKRSAGHSPRVDPSVAPQLEPERRDTDEQSFDGPPTEEMWGVEGDGAPTLQMTRPQDWEEEASEEPAEEVIILDTPKGGLVAAGEPSPAQREREAADLERRKTSVFQGVRRGGRPTEVSDLPSDLPDVEPRDTEEVHESHAPEPGALPRRRRNTIPGMPALQPGAIKPTANAPPRAAPASEPQRRPANKLALERVRTTQRGVSHNVQARAESEIRGALRRALAGIRVAGSISAAADLALGFLGQICQRRALIRIIDNDLVGWAWAGRGPAPGAIESLRIPIEISSVFGAVAHSRIPYQGPLLDGPEERVFGAFVGEHPGDIILVPIVAEGEVVALIYGDGLLPGSSLSLLRELAREIGAALRRLGEIGT